MGAPLPIPEIGTRFGHLTVIENDKRIWKKQVRSCKCKCDCGSISIVPNSSLYSGRVKSCRCKIGQATIPLGTGSGESDTRLYRIWHHMIHRCFDPNTIRYEHWGGKGVTVCDEWMKGFSVFKQWALESGYSDELSLDRIDVNGNYEPSNCKWSTAVEQANNTTANKRITYDGRTQTEAMWAREMGIKCGTLSYRLRHGWSIERALTEPVKHY